MKKVNQILFGHIGPLLLGSLIYIFFRSEKLIVFNWLERVNLLNKVKEIRSYTLAFSSSIPDWTLYSLPDGLWLFSYVSIIMLFWKNKITSNNICWILILPILAILSEVGQYYGIVKGTFDIIDLTFYVLAVFISIFIYTKLITLKIEI